ncbi:MAG: 50S ribosomal protein L9 [Gammaproteobacteria bacterium]|jgi:large subunit ribosomal protein L9|nr:50S ribosomal protein L9 [Gammaproteobacteria bacterium]|tara:strand:- start:922 stop:1554 length:633 start_codon:yes stop_codon:yes gene_type:complete
MNVILLEKIGKLGEIGDTAKVKSGYARNFLFPFGKAIPATEENLVQFEQRRSELMAAHDVNVAASQKRAEKVDGIKITVEVNASDDGKLFGSVGTKDIADALNAAAAGADVEKSEVHLPHGVIREVGEFEVALDFGYDVAGLITLSVITQQSAASVSDDGRIEELIEEEAAAAESSEEVSAKAATDEATDESAEEVSSAEATDQPAAPET